MSTILICLSRWYPYYLYTFLSPNRTNFSSSNRNRNKRFCNILIYLRQKIILSLKNSYFYSIGDYYRKRVYGGDFLRATLNGKEWSVPCKGCVVGLVGSFALFLTACSGQRRSWSFEECMNLVGYTYYAHCAHAPKIFSLFNRFNHMLPRFKHETQDLFYQYSFLNLTNKPFLPQFPFTEPSRIIEFKTLQSNHLYINVYSMKNFTLTNHEFD